MQIDGLYFIPDDMTSAHDIYMWLDAHLTCLQDPEDSSMSTYDEEDTTPLLWDLCLAANSRPYFLLPLRATLHI